MDYDVAVIGAGHAGCEAALAAARLGLSVCLITMGTDTIAQLSCNPAIGGLAKGHLVREIDALGGEMARVTDEAGIQFRVLNRSKGPAVWSLRAQADRAMYRTAMQRRINTQQGLDVIKAEAEDILIRDGQATGVRTTGGRQYATRAVIVTTGTFLGGLMHVGLSSTEGGRAGEAASVGLSASLKKLGLLMGRLKTGTPPRLKAGTIDFEATTPQPGDEPPLPFSYHTERITNPQLPCYITYTTPGTHAIIRDNLDRSPMYSGVITGIGPRYCPSIEDKVVRFAGRDRHQVFLEPEGIGSDEYYANGISTSLPLDVQQRLVRSIPGLEHCEIARPGYAVEYDFVFPPQLRHSLECKELGGLFLAGQINGTSGYEEAAAQGLMAGINAALALLGREPLVLGRQEAYIGVLIDDLVTRGTAEPYRMFTSRAEYRLLLRHDNADMRLVAKGFQTGLVSAEDYERFVRKKETIEREMQRLEDTHVSPRSANPALRERGSEPLTDGAALSQLLRRPEVDYALIQEVSPPPSPLGPEVREQVTVQTKYAGYIRRQEAAADKLRRSDDMKIPPDFDYEAVHGLSNEAVSKLKEIRPRSIGQAGRIPGMTPAAISLVMMGVQRQRRAAG